MLKKNLAALLHMMKVEGDLECQKWSVQLVQHIPSLMNPQHSRAGHISVLMPLRSNLRSNSNMFEWAHNAYQRTWYRFIWIKYSFLKCLKMLIIPLKFHNGIINVILNNNVPYIQTKNKLQYTMYMHTSVKLCPIKKKCLTLTKATFTGSKIQ